MRENVAREIAASIYSIFPEPLAVTYKILARMARKCDKKNNNNIKVQKPKEKTRAKRKYYERLTSLAVATPAADPFRGFNRGQTREICKS